MFVRCEHGNSAEQCHECRWKNRPPAGYHYDWNFCSTCYRTREMHDKVEAKVSPADRHTLTPTLKRGSLTPYLPGQHLHLVQP